MLRVFFAVLAGLVRYRKMRKDALRIQSGQRAAVADSRNARLKIISVAQIPQTRHSGIHLDVNLKDAAAFDRLFAVLKRFRLAADRLCNVILDQPRHLLLRCVAEN